MKVKSHNVWKGMQVLVVLGIIGFTAVSSTFGEGGYYFVTKWGSQGSGPGEFNTANGVAVDQFGYVFVADFYNSRVQKFTHNGEFINTWGDEIIPYRVEHLAVDLQGFVYVADYDRRKIVKFTSTGEFVTEWGGVHSPYGVAVDNQGHVFVSSHFGNSIHKFTDDGQVITSWGGTYGSEIGQFKYPNGIAVDGAGRVFVTDLYNERIQIFSSDGVFLDVWDYYDIAYDVCIDSLGYVYVTNGDTDSPYRIHKFTSNGDLVTEWGTSGSGNGQFDRPRGIAVDLLGSVYVCDYGNNRIQKFAEKGGWPPPYFNSPECGSTSRVEPGETVEFTVIAEDEPERTVTLNVSGLPPGGIMSPLLPVIGNPVSSDFTWTTDDSHNNTGHIVEFTATNNAGLYARCRVGIEVGDYTLVTLASFTAIPGDGQVTLHWTTASEIDNAGFYLLRSAVAARGTVRLHKGLIPAMGDVFTGADYSYVDETAVNGVEYEYTLVDVDLYGTETHHPPVRAIPNPSVPTLSMQR